MSTQDRDAMKVCNVCGESYLDHIDFCFNDGEVLVAQESPLDVPEPAHLDAPPVPRHMRQQGQQLPPTRSGTPIPRAKRSLLNRPQAASSSAGAYTPPSPEEPVTASPSAPAAPEDSQVGRGPSRPTLIPDMGLDESPDDLDDRELPPSQVETMPMPRPIKGQGLAQNQVPLGGPAQNQVPLRGPAEEPVRAASPPRPQPTPPPPSEPVDDDLDELIETGPNRKVLVAAALGMAGLLLMGGGTMIAVGLGLLGTSQTASDDPGDAVVPATPIEQIVDQEPDPEEDVGAAGSEPAEDPQEEEVGAQDVAEDPEEIVSEDVEAPEDLEEEPEDPPQAARPAPQPAAAPAPAPTVAEARPAPEPALGAVRFRSQPGGATVRVDGNPVGTTPVRVELPLGVHTVELQLAGHKPLSQQIEVTPGESTLPAWSLVAEAPEPPAAPKVPVMVFFSGRVGDQLFVDGAPQGELPARIELTEGRHVFEVRGAQGDFKVSREVTGNSNGSAAIIQLAQ